MIWGLTLGTDDLQLDNATNQPKELLKIVNENGQETKLKPNTVLFYLYSDGTVKKVFEVE